MNGTAFFLPYDSGSIFLAWNLQFGQDNFKFIEKSNFSPNIELHDIITPPKIYLSQLLVRVIYSN